MTISVSSSDELIRLDTFLSSRLIQFSRSKIQKLILNGNITVNKKAAKKNLKLSFGDKIYIDKNSFELNEISPTLEKWDYPVEIIYKDNNFAIINKPLGIISHPTANNKDRTIVNILLSKFKEELNNHPDSLRPGIVHRLDRDTTGVMIIPFNEHAHWKIAEQFKNRKVQKKYIALTWGHWNENKGKIENNLARCKKNPLKFKSSYKGRNSISEFNLLKSGRYFSAVNFYPKTGRTHQIRVHCSEHGFPIVGDDLYGGGFSKINEYLPEIQKKMKKIISQNNGHYLHASKISFIHPETQKKMTFEAKPNEYFNNLLSMISNNEI